MRKRCAAGCFSCAGAEMTSGTEQEGGAEALKRLSGAAFAKKHGVHPQHAADKKRERFGRTLRRSGWWRTPTLLRLLRSNLHRDDAAKRLGISPVLVNTLRRILWREENGTTSRRPDIRRD